MAAPIGGHSNAAGAVTAPEGAEDSSHLTRLQRYAYAAGAVGVWGPIVAFSALRSTIYVIYLEAVRVHAAVRVCVCAFACTSTCKRMRTRVRVHALRVHLRPPCMRMRDAPL